MKNSFAAVCRWTREGIVITLTAGQWSVPLRSVGAAHHAGESGVALQLVAWLAVEGQTGAQFIVASQSSTVHHAAWVKTCLSQLS